MTHLDVFRRLSSADNRLGFFTKDLKNSIPESSGCYAWILPLWLYADDLDDLLKRVCDLYCFEQPPEREIEAGFNWEYVRMDVRRGAKVQVSEEMRKLWAQVMANSDSKDALQNALMEATLLMPPLYVGRTSNLLRRYLQHTDTRDSDRNTFGNRFREFASRVGLRLGVSDLVFVCIQTGGKTENKCLDVNETDMNRLIERILMGFCRPPFSLE